MNILTALESLASAVTTIETVTNHITTSVSLLSTATKEGRDITEAELKQVIARADFSRMSLEEALSA